MRAEWMVLLLLLPLASGLQTPGTPHAPPLPVVSGHERLLVLDEGVWTSADWQNLLKKGVQPLRSVSPEALLVWQEGQVDWGDNVAVLPFNDVAYLQPLHPQQDGHGAVRVVFEPRLPQAAVDHINERLSAMASVPPTASEGVASLPASSVIDLVNPWSVTDLLDLEGVLWVEPVLTPTARNGQASGLIQAGALDSEPFWSVGLNGQGVVLGVADSGLDADHACFRNASTATGPHSEPSATYPAVGVFGESHRKILHLNTSIDGNDTPGHSDYRHGTHVIGSLGCYDVEAHRNADFPANGSTVAYGTKLVVQDIVSEDGWLPPSVDELLWEASSYGAVIHSNSWGDDTTAYTQRTGTFDAYARAMPWSVAVIAPGNSGEGILEPANGRNVVAVGASTKASEPERWSSSSYGPTEAGTDGVFVLAPGASIMSAGGDGFWSTNNNNLRPSSGTSMATPLASSAMGILQQMYEDGWLHGAHEPLASVTMERPAWSSATVPDNVLLGEGFTPSGPLLRATLALATHPLSDVERNGGEGGDILHNPYDGWGVTNLSRLIDISALENGTSPSSSLWVHDSYRLDKGGVSPWFQDHASEANNLTGFANTSWDGTGASGPFLQTGDVFEQRFSPLSNRSVRLRLAFPAQPEPALVDDLQLRVVLEDGRVLLADRLNALGEPVKYNATVADFNDFDVFPNSNETVVGLDVPAHYMTNASWFDVQVVARYVQPGGEQGSVGLDGDATGFSLVVQGVERDATDHLDGDGDGVANFNDRCPFEDASAADADRDGCLDDSDGDGVVDPVDECPSINASEHDADLDGCLDDSDGDGVTDDVDACFTQDIAWPVTATGCYPVDVPPSLNVHLAPLNNSKLGDTVQIDWSLEDADGDNANVSISLVFSGQSTPPLASCSGTVLVSEIQSCEWDIPADLAPYFIAGATYDIIASVETGNRSPASATGDRRLVLVSGVALPEKADTTSELSEAEVGQSAVFIALFGLLLGALVARWNRSRSRVNDHLEIAAPFQEGHKNEGAVALDEESPP
jgi:hypothetical protein